MAPRFRGLDLSYSPRKGKVHPRGGHESPEEEFRYSFTLSLTLDRGGWSTPCPGRFTQGRFGWERKISSPHWDPLPGPSTYTIPAQQLCTKLQISHAWTSPYSARITKYVLWFTSVIERLLLTLNVEKQSIARFFYQENIFYQINCSEPKRVAFLNELRFYTESTNSLQKAFLFLVLTLGTIYPTHYALSSLYALLSATFRFLL